MPLSDAEQQQPSVEPSLIRSRLTHRLKQARPRPSPHDRAVGVQISETLERGRVTRGSTHHRVHEGAGSATEQELHLRVQVAREPGLPMAGTAVQVREDVERRFVGVGLLLARVRR